MLPSKILQLLGSARNESRRRDDDRRPGAGVCFAFSATLLPHVSLKRKYNAIKDLKLIRLEEWRIRMCNVLCDITQFVITFWVRRVMEIMDI